MKKVGLAIAAIAIIVIGGFWLANANNTEDTGSQNNQLVIGATIFPLYDIAKTVAGEDITVKQVLPSGTSPHTFEATPGTIRNLQDVDVFYAIGHELDSWIVELANTTDAEVVIVDSGIELREFGEGHDEHKEDEHKEEHGDHHDEDEHGHSDDHNDEDHEDEHKEEGHHHDHEGVDPHYWLDPLNGVTMARTIAEDLSNRLPEQKNAFEDRAETFATNIANENKTWEKKINALSQKDIVTFHDAFGYFAGHFGLDVVATYEPFPGKEPTPQYLRELQERIERDKIQAVFLEPQLATNSIESFAKDVGVALGVLDPLGGAEGRETYKDLIEHNVNEIVETLN